MWARGEHLCIGPRTCPEIRPATGPPPVAARRCRPPQADTVIRVGVEEWDTDAAGRPQEESWRFFGRRCQELGCDGIYKLNYLCKPIGLSENKMKFLTLVATFFALSFPFVGALEASVILNIWDDGSDIHYQFDGGTLDITGLTTGVTTLSLTPTSVGEVYHYDGSGGFYGVWRSVNTSSMRRMSGSVTSIASSGWTDSGTQGWAPGVLLSGTGYALAKNGEMNLGIDSGTSLANSTTSIDAHYTTAGSLASFGYTANESLQFTLASGDTFTIVTAAPDAAVPEPSTYLTLSGLILCFGLAGWWRKRRNPARRSD